MNDIRPIQELFADLDELRGVLDDLNVKFITVAANGHWSYEKLGRARHGSSPLERGQILRLADLIPTDRPMRSGDWALRKYEGVSGPSILIERLPVAVADRLPQEVLATLKRQIRGSGNGVLVGEPGSGKDALLLWLALQIPDQPVLYIAENPPSEFPGTHVIHVFPPSTAAERRALERFARLSPIVMWDRLVHLEDFQTLYSYPGAQRRWFTTDASSVRSALRLLTAAAQNGCDARFSTMLHLASSVIGRPEARALLVRGEDGWGEPWIAGDSVVDFLDAYDSRDMQSLRPTEMSSPQIQIDAAPEPEPQPEPEPEGTIAPEAAGLGGAPSAAVMKPRAIQVENITAEGEAINPTALMPPPTVPDAPVEDHPLTVEVDPDDIQEDDAITGMIPADSIDELQDSGMLKAALPAGIPQAQPIPEATKAYLETPTEIVNGEVTNPAAYLVGILPNINLDEISPETSKVNLDEYRITSMEELSEEEIEVIHEVVNISQDYSDVFEAELDFESLAEEMMSEISEVETARRDSPIAPPNPNRLVIIESDLQNKYTDEPELDDSRTVAGGADLLRLAQLSSGEVPEEGEESTREFTLNEQLLMLRKRRSDE